MQIIEKSFEPLQTELPDALRNPPRVPYVAFKAMARANLAKMRAGMGGNSKDIVGQPVSTRQHVIEGHAGPVTVRIYAPEAKATASRPLLVYFHGGGWFGGTMEAVEAFCQAVADQADAVVVNVGYHLCPEHPYPHGLEDCYRATLWAAGDPDLGIDQNKVAVGGDSAGGNLAAAVSLMARDRGAPAINKQLLIYPAVTLHDFVSPTGERGGAFGRLLTDWYLAGATKTTDPYVSPILAPTLAGLPAALVAVCETDGLKEQGVAYAQKLADAGVEARCLLYKGADHAFIDNTGTQPAANDLAEESARFLRGL
ncbi:MAG: alpha/beta hydrolase [Clostridia bacterium]|nr:alpha/beta hydrolase [Clostridia bacterium]